MCSISNKIKALTKSLYFIVSFFFYYKKELTEKYKMASLWVKADS